VANKAIARTLAFDIKLFRLKSPPLFQTLDGEASFLLRLLATPQSLAAAFASTYIVPKEG
jgi:hypothetical protein